MFNGQDLTRPDFLSEDLQLERTDIVCANAERSIVDKTWANPFQHVVEHLLVISMEPPIQVNKRDAASTLNPEYSRICVSVSITRSAIARMKG